MNCTSALRDGWLHSSEATNLLASAEAVMRTGKLFTPAARGKIAMIEPP